MTRRNGADGRGWICWRTSIDAFWWLVIDDFRPSIVSHHSLSDPLVDSRRPAIWTSIGIWIPTWILTLSRIVTSSCPPSVVCCFLGDLGSRIVSCFATSGDCVTLTVTVTMPKRICCADAYVHGQHRDHVRDGRVVRNDLGHIHLLCREIACLGISSEDAAC
jgi:hypothetical protein